MSIKSAIYDPATRLVWHAAKSFNGHLLQVVSSYFEIHGVFKTSLITTATTTDLAMPPNGGALVVTNILIGAAKKVGGTVDIIYSDGVNTETLYEADLTNNSVNLSVSIPHGWRGWEDAVLQCVTNSTARVSVTVGYIHIPIGEQFSAWDAKR